MKITILSILIFVTTFFVFNYEKNTDLLFLSFPTYIAIIYFDKVTKVVKEISNINQNISNKIIMNRKNQNNFYKKRTI